MYNSEVEVDETEKYCKSTKNKFMIKKRRNDSRKKYRERKKIN